MSNALPDFTSGQPVYHRKFGAGIVTDAKPDKVTVDFKTIGQKVLSPVFLTAGDLPIGPAWADRVRARRTEPVAPGPMPRAANDNDPATRLVQPPRQSIAQAVDAQALLGMDFPPVQYVVPGYITEGLTIFAGRPKLGKSWLALGMGVAVATGGWVLGVQCEQGDAILLALEDNARRLKDRLKVILPPAMVGLPNMSRLKLPTSAPSTDAGLVAELERWRMEAADPRLVIIDTLAKVRPARKGNQDQYAADYAAIVPLQEWALQHRIAVIVVHHVRKMEAEDPLEAVSGTNGLTGAADTILVLNRDHDGPKLYGRGRDIEDIEKALRFDNGRWTVLGNADDVRQSEQRTKILKALTDAEAVVGPKEIAAESGLSVDVVRHLLPRLIKDGRVEKVSRAQYKLTGR